VCAKLVASMASRVLCIHNARGGPTKYWNRHLVTKKCALWNVILFITISQGGNVNLHGFGPTFFLKKI
jgi:hypothetical protein